MATRLSWLFVISQSKCSRLRAPQPIWTQFSLLPGLAAANRLGPERKRSADKAPAASAVRLRNDRRFKITAIRHDNTGKT
jgi:hypothetical protein